MFQYCAADEVLRGTKNNSNRTGATRALALCVYVCRIPETKVLGKDRYLVPRDQYGAAQAHAHMYACIKTEREYVMNIVE